MDKAHGIRAIPRPSKPDDPDTIAEVVRGIEATTRQALRRFTVALILAVTLVLGVLVGMAPVRSALEPSQKPLAREDQQP